LINFYKSIAMERSIEEREKTKSSNSELSIQRTQHSMLFKLFVNALKDYNESQLNFKTNCKTRIRRQLEISKTFRTIIIE